MDRTPFFSILCFNGEREKRGLFHSLTFSPSSSTSSNVYELPLGFFPRIKKNLSKVSTAVIALQSLFFFYPVPNNMILYYLKKNIIIQFLLMRLISVYKGSCNMRGTSVFGLGMAKKVQPAGLGRMYQIAAHGLVHRDSP